MASFSSFPEMFCAGFSHIAMCVRKRSNEVFDVVPSSSSQDWSFTLQKMNDTTWLATGCKEDSFSSPQTYNMTFELVDKQWQMTEMTDRK
jgi:hypothetical protein